MLEDKEESYIMIIEKKKILQNIIDCEQQLIWPQDI